MRYYFKPVRMVILKKIKHALMRMWENCTLLITCTDEDVGHLYTVDNMHR